MELITLELINVVSIRKFLAMVVQHYEKSAPTVSSWADDLYIRLAEYANEVRISEVLVAQCLLDNDGWEHPNYAANRIYKLMDALGQDTTGHIGY